MKIAVAICQYILSMHNLEQGSEPHVRRQNRSHVTTHAAHTHMLP